VPSGYAGHILRIDLSRKEVSTESVDRYTRSFVGGRGITVKIAYDEVDPGISPFDPDNRLVLGPGVLTGTPAPGTGRMKVTAMCPNGLLASAGLGGFIGPEIRYAGYDTIIVQGKADSPVYLYIRDDAIEFRDAVHIWGEDTWETQQKIKAETGDPDVQVMCIGPAGENLVSFAGIMTGMFSAAGRGGFGAVMGAKNLKAVAVRGKRGIEVADVEEFLQLSLETCKNIPKSPDFLKMVRSGVFDPTRTHLNKGMAVFGNWEDDDWDTIGAGDYPAGIKELWSRYAVDRTGCSGCPMHNFTVFDVPGIGVGAPKCVFSAVLNFPIWTKDCRLLFHVGYLCNRYGLDFSSTGNVIGFLMDLYHRGIIAAKDTDGIPMRRGDKDAVISTIHKTARYEGFGKLLRDGVLEAAKTIGKGAEERAVHVKQLEMQSYEYRAYKGVALAAAVAGKDQLEALPVFEYGRYEPGRPEQWAEELYGTKKAADPPSYEKKALSVWDFENRYSGMDMLGMCKFFLMILTPYLKTPARLLSLATGMDTTEDELLTAAQRVRTLERAFNVLRGIRRKDDTLPKRLFETPVPGGRFKGHTLDRKKFDRMVDEYYALCGWDDDGIPKEETFSRFGLSSEWQAFQKRMKNNVEPPDKGDRL